MRRTLADLLRILARSLPALMAWYLAGELVRYLVISLAAPLSFDSGLLPLLFLPIAVLARLVAFVGMFLVARGAMREYLAVPGGGIPPTLRERAREFGDVLFSSIVPFFVLYALIGGVAEDLADYAVTAFYYSFGSGRYVLDPGSGPVVAAVVVVAFVLRILVDRFSERLPAFFSVIEIYLEATWIFVAVGGLTAVLGDVGGWFGSRRIVVAVQEARAGLEDVWSGLEVVFRGIDGAVPLVLQVIVLPLAWLLIAGVIYTRAIAESRHERLMPVRVEARLRVRLAALPRFVQRSIRSSVRLWYETAEPVLISGRMILGTRARILVVLMALSGLLYAAHQWLFRGTLVLIGPHELPYARDAYHNVSVALGLVTEPIRVALLAAVFDQVIGRWWRRRTGDLSPQRLPRIPPLSRAGRTAARTGRSTDGSPRPSAP
ncbi:hypothetical protein [Schumannella sp. 10F1B-5-1]|uniref:hypothetical protein n=1 Tax=Schumannella sp. 10F1B-5-1 TaxID=2590780 RepID=UPI001130DFAC|nr:hypothetical protein [Schumannella sp. 10F1B-5-1]TPW70761.1 hypothetical protein FJ658_11565 [Schumannella sp. 10F1B-5-1]